MPIITVEVAKKVMLINMPRIKNPKPAKVNPEAKPSNPSIQLIAF